jgi:hypothetical protein
MTECNNSEVRDLLPDYVAERLPAGDQAMLDGHLAGCAFCRDEIALLRVALAVRPRGIDIDVARIVAALPARPQAGLRLVPSDNHRDAAGVRTLPPTIALPHRQPRRAPMSQVWKIAATLGICAIGGWSVLTMREVSGSANATGAAVATRGAAPTADSARPAVVVAIGETLDVAAGKRETAPTPARQSALSLGDLSEYSDAELQRVLERLDKWDGATSADPLPASAILSGSVRGML